jgi:hypothetical protein
MSGTPRQVAPPYDPLRHILSVHEVEAQLLAAGVPRSRRHIQRLCKNQSLDAAPLGANDEWYIAPDSVPKVIGDLRALEEQRARRVATQHDVAHDVAPRMPLSNGHDVPRHVAPQRDTSAAQDSEVSGATTNDGARYVALLEQDNEFLRDQVKKKDEQISDLSMRFSETQTLLGAMQRMLAPLLGQADPFTKPENREARTPAANHS